jgi:hypothetical protein
MAEPSSHVLELARRGAAVRLRELAREVELLLDLFPDIGETFDADELPVTFILRRDARGTEAGRVSPRKARVAADRKAVTRRVKQDWVERRAGSKQ